MNTTIACNSDRGLPKVSIIVPVYKVENYLPRCLDSILGQFFTDFELLLINDGSPDNSGKICDEYAVKDSRIRVFHQSNGGVSVARNTGLDNARGEWIAFVDSDDWVDAGWLDIFALETAPSIEHYDLMVYGRKKVGDSSVIYEYTPATANETPIDYMNSNEFYMVAVWSCFFRHTIIERFWIRFSPGLKYAEDTEFLLKCFVSSERLLVLGTALYNYYLRETSATNTASSDFWRASQDLISVNGFLRYCAANRIPVDQLGATVKRSYRIFLRNYLRDSNPRFGDKTEFLRLYRDTIAHHRPFKKNILFRFISNAWMPSLLAIRTAMRLNRSLTNTTPFK